MDAFRRLRTRRHAAVGRAVTVTMTALLVAGAAIGTLGVRAAGAAPVLAVSPTTVNFTTQLTGTTSLGQNVLVSNSGTTLMAVSAVALSGTNASDFAVTNACTTPVAAGSSCLVSLTFTPSAAGDRSASLTVTSDGGTGTVAVTGTAIAAAPVLSTQPGVVTFTSVNVGSAATASETVTNTGSAALTLGSLTIGGTNAAEFTVTNGCPTAIAPAANCVLTVRFAPTAPGNRSGTLSIASNGGTATVTLSGGAVPAVPVLSIDAAVAIPDQPLGLTSAARSVTVTNSGTAPLLVSSATLTGTNSAEFAVVNGCTAAVAPGGTCALALRHTPKALGARSASLSISSNAGNKSVPITGNGSIAGSCPTNPTGWYGQYWTNTSQTGVPALCRNDVGVGFSWPTTPPVGNNLANFSARWTKVVSAPFSGSYLFGASGTDGARLFVDGVLVIDSWRDSAVSTLRTVSVPLAAGTHTVVFDFYSRRSFGAFAFLSSPL